MGTNLNKWDDFYKDLDAPDHYGDTPTYEMGIDFLSSCSDVEDWGCGKGWFKHLVKGRFPVTALDGSETPFADKVVDLEEYRSKASGIFMRHVIEHNYKWDVVLENALASFRSKMFLAIFTPMNNGDEAEELAFVPVYNVPDMSLPTKVVEFMIRKHGASFTKDVLKSESAYGLETIYMMKKNR